MKLRLWRPTIHAPKTEIPEDDSHRPRYGDCPSCGVPQEKYCELGCPLIDNYDTN